MEKETSFSIRVGLFVIMGVTCLVLGVYLIGSKQNLFSSNIRIHAMFRNVGGLQRGNNVRFAGINAGTVEDIIILNDSTIQVNMIIERKAAAFIRRDAPAIIGTDGLMGARLVNIGLGSETGSMVKDGDAIRGVEPLQIDEMLQILGESGKNVNGITSDIKKITGTFNSGKLDSMMGNLEDATAHASRMSGNLAGIVDDVRNGKGTLGKLLSDTSLENRLTGSVAAISRTTDDLRQVSNNLKEGEGSLGVLLSDTSAAGSMKRSMKNVEQGTKSFSENMEALKHNFLFRKYFKKQEEKAKEEQGEKK